MSVTPGTRFGTYEVTALLGAGGMGEVYRARDPRLGRDVALKILSPKLAGNREAVARFEQEARSASALSHPHILHIYDIGTTEVASESVRYIVMELVDGATLGAKMQSAEMRELFESPRSRTASPRPTPRASSIAISSPTTSWSRPTATRRSSTSDWPS